MSLNPTSVNARQKREKTKNAIIFVLAAGLIVTSGYLVLSEKKSAETIQIKEVKIASLVGEKSELQGNFDASLARLDSMSDANGMLQKELSSKNDEISKVKTEIRTILNKKNASQKELARARNLISELNGKITTLEGEVVRLAKANEELTVEKNNLLTDKENLTQNLTATVKVKEELEQKVDVASTLNASNINITPVNLKKSGKEIVSTKAKKVDKLLVSFSVDNRIIQNGSTDVYVLVLGPDGKPLTNGETGTFATRAEGEKQFTAKLPIELETAKKQNVEFSFAPGNFQQGNYKIQIYQNGFLIGEGVRPLRKGGLFS
jgi:hypothetical protein